MFIPKKFVAACMGGILSLLPFDLLQADVRLPAIFSDHMVLQKGAEVPVWGWASPGEQVTVTLDKTNSQATAGPDGKWKTKLDLSGEGQGPFQFTVEGKNKLVVNDVVIGEVWLCSGQSNMAFQLVYSLGGKEEMARSENQLFRMFNAGNGGGVTPQEDVPGSWSVASPATSGGFSAVGYYFGKSLQNELKVPVGIVHTSKVATACQAWTSAEALDQDPEAKKQRDETLGQWVSLPKRFADYQAAFPAWAAKYGRADHPPADPATFAGPDISTADWKTVKFPGKLKDSRMPDAGVVWIRHKVTVTDAQANKVFVQGLSWELRYGTVYWNGVKVDEVSPEAPLRTAVMWEEPWTARIPAAQAKAGDAVLAIRLYSPAGGAGLFFEEKNIPRFVGDWLAKTEYELPPLSPEALASNPGVPPVQNTNETLLPTYTFNGQLAPLIPYAIKGAIWYQGEGNTSEAFHYRTLLPLMITDWRKRWGHDFPFYIVQLPNSGAKKPGPGESQWAETREAQMMALSLRNTGLAVTIDTADANLHPSNKKEPGERLALVALAKTYGLKKIYSGPIFDSMKIENDKVKIQFTHTDGGLVARPLSSTYVLKYTSLSPEVAETAPLVLPVPDSPVQGFALCGDDHQWKWASARIEGDGVMVWAVGVDKPVAVRYAWADNPTCNLYNGAGLPAAPFSDR